MNEIKTHHNVKYINYLGGKVSCSYFIAKPVALIHC